MVFRQIRNKTKQRETENDMNAVEITTDGHHIARIGEDYALYEKTEKALELKPHSRYALMAVELPDGYRLATDADKAADHKRILFTDGDENWWDTAGIDGDYLHVVPIAQLRRRFLKLPLIQPTSPFPNRPVGL